MSGGEAKITLNGAVITVSEAGDVSITSPTKIELTAPGRSTPQRAPGT